MSHFTPRYVTNRDKGESVYGERIRTRDVVKQNNGTLYSLLFSADMDPLIL